MFYKVCLKLRFFTQDLCVLREWLKFIYPTKRQAPSDRGAWVVKAPKSTAETHLAHGISARELRSLLENHAIGLHFEGSDERLREHLAVLAAQESLNLENWRVIHGGDNSKIVQVKLSGDREIRRLVRLITPTL